MDSDNLVKCAHAPCRCKVDMGEDYCSPACASAQSPTMRCPCGHPECMNFEQVADGD